MKELEQKLNELSQRLNEQGEYKMQAGVLLAKQIYQELQESNNKQLLTESNISNGLKLDC